jgi:3-hydroxyisobutyrate dehydrogenase-like beta-hydroxyacid dehydrogenase
MPPQTPVGLIGVGLMGEVYACRLIAAGFGVIGFDIVAARNERLAQIGGRAGALADIARQCDPILLAVFSTDQVEEVVERALVPAAAGKIRLMIEQADKVGQELPLLAVHAAVLEACIRHGDGEMDNSIVVEEIRRRSRVKPM